MNKPVISLVGGLFLSMSLTAQTNVMHVATPHGEISFRTHDVDSIYFDFDDRETNRIISSLNVYQEQKNYYPSDLFTQSLIICHRGLPGYPENTKEALQAAIKVGYKMLECDVARTSDGVFVLQHDATIDRCSNGTGRVDKHTFAELQELDFGSWYSPEFSFVRIAALEDIIKMCKRKNVVLELDIAEDDRFSDKYLLDLFKLVQKYGMLSRTVFCAKQSRLEALQAISSCVCVSVSGVRDLRTAQAAVSLKQKSLCINVSIPFDMLSPELCEFAHSNGMYVKTWTYNFDNDAEEAFNAGADYVIVQNVLPPFSVRANKPQSDE